MRGPYVAHNPRLPIHGLGDDDLPQVGFADQVLREMSSARPLGTLVPWAEQVSDVTWKEVPAEHAYSCFPVTDVQLQQAKAAAGGHEVTWVAILFSQPATLNAIERALFATPYALSSSQAVYPPSYSGEVPRISFLVWARLRDSMAGDGSGGGNRSMDEAARSLNGSLVYVVPSNLPDTTRRPTVSFSRALDAQLGITAPPIQTLPLFSQASSSDAPLVDAPPVPTTVPASVRTNQASEATSSSKRTLAWVLAGGIAAFAFVWWMSSRDERVESGAR